MNNKAVLIQSFTSLRNHKLNVIASIQSMRGNVAIHKIFFPLLMILITLFFTACSDDKPVYSISTGAGYNVSLVVSHKEISDGGSFSITAYITDPNGDPVPDEEEVVKFSCSQNEVKFEDEKCDVKNGFAATTAQWEDQSDDDNPDPPMNATITATYKGAVSSAQVILISKAF